LNGDLRGHFAIRIQAISNDREGVISWILSNSGQKWNSEHLQIFRTIRIRDFLFHIKNLVFVFEEAQKDDMWFFNWTMTQDQADQFRGYAIPLIKKVFKCNRQKAEATFSWFFLEFGLRVKD
jgi:hypothetical protein